MGNLATGFTVTADNRIVDSRSGCDHKYWERSCRVHGFWTRKPTQVEIGRQVSSG